MKVRKHNLEAPGALVSWHPFESSASAVNLSQ